MLQDMQNIDLALHIGRYSTRMKINFICLGNKRKIETPTDVILIR